MDLSPVLSAKEAPKKASSPGNGERYITLRSIVALDDEWPEGETTERLAFSQALKLLPEIPAVSYFAFPWARLIDLLQSKHADGDRLLGVLAAAKGLLGGQCDIVTVCQHKDLLEHQELFAEAGMTHLFWPHRQIGQDRLPDHPHVRLWPFPCAPCPLADSLPHRTERSRLYTYAGIDSQHLSPAREPDPILYQPTTDRAGLVVTPPQAGISPPTLESSWWNGSPVSIEALRIMHSSTFSLCPEANSSWLWTSVASEAIPVFFEKMPPLPGNRSLWEEATVCCPAGREAVLELPGRLENLARSDDLLEIKRRALRQLRLLYGADCFIYDILKLFVSLAGTSAGKITARAGLPYGPLHGLAAQIIQGSESGRSCANIFTLGCGSRVLADSSAFLMHYQRDDQFRLACQKAFAVCDEYPRELLRQALALKNLELDDCDAIKSTGGTTPC